MSLLDDLIVDALFSGIGPATNRGLVILFTIGGLALAVTSGLLVAGGVDILQPPDWKIGALLASLLVGWAGMFIAVLRLRREATDKLLAATCFAINFVAASAPFVALVH